MKKLSLALAILVMFLTLLDCSNLNQTPTTTTQIVTIATYNIEGKYITSASSSKAINQAQIIKTNNVEVIMMQEVNPINNYSDTNDNNDVGSLKTALESAGYPLNYDSITLNPISKNYPDDDIAIMSKWQINSTEEICYGTLQDPVTGNSYPMIGTGNTNDPADYQYPLRPVFKVVVNVLDSKPVTFYGVHLKSEYGGLVTSIEQRRAQTACLGNYIKTNHNTNDHYLILGDFNAARTSADETNVQSSNSSLFYASLRDDANTENDLKAPNYEDSTLRVTPTQGSGTFPIDYIFLSPSLYNRYISNSCYYGPTGSSDHRAIILQLGL